MLSILAVVVSLALLMFFAYRGVTVLLLAPLMGALAVLMSGDHAAIRRWRRQQSLGRTWLRRPDLLARTVLDKADRAALEQFIAQWRADPPASG